MIYSTYTVGGELYHHGIKGQKWGVQNGPPYPLSENSHSGEEKTRSALDRVKAKKMSEASKEGFFTEIAIISAIYALPLLPLAAVGIHDKASKNIGERKLNKNDAKKTGEIDTKTNLHKKTEKDTNNSVEDDMKQVNVGHKYNVDGTHQNCVYCTMTLEMRRRGYDASANYSEDGASGRKVAADMFKNVKYKNVSASDEVSFDSKKMNFKIKNSQADKMNYDNNVRLAQKNKNTKLAQKTMQALSNEKDGSRGCLFIQWGVGGGHAMNYEIKNGQVRILDSQTNKIYTGSKAEKMLASGYFVSFARLDNLQCKNNKKLINVLMR